MLGHRERVSLSGYGLLLWPRAQVRSEGPGFGSWSFEVTKHALSSSWAEAKSILGFCVRPFLALNKGDCKTITQKSSSNGAN